MDWEPIIWAVIWIVVGLISLGIVAWIIVAAISATAFRRVSKSFDDDSFFRRRL